MIWIKYTFAILLTLVIGFGSSALPNAAANGVVDRIFEAMMKGTLPPSDLRILENAAEGRFEEADVAVALSLGIRRADFSPLAFRAEGARAHALMKIGETGFPEALEYLKNIRFEDVRNFQSEQPWHAARIALHIAQMKTIPEAELRIAFLRKALTDKDAGVDDSAVHTWAMTELCDRGELDALTDIRQYLRRIYSGERAEEQIHSCEARMEVVSRSSDRVQALASVLRADGPPGDSNLIGWDVRQLAALDSPTAFRALVRFDAEIKALPPGSEIRQRLFGAEDAIRVYLERRSNQ